MAKILIADDSLAELQIFQAALQSTGHSIVTVMDGEAAEAKVKSEKIDLIILDVVMPKKNGSRCAGISRATTSTRTSRSSW